MAMVDFRKFDVLLQPWNYTFFQWYHNYTWISTT